MSAGIVPALFFCLATGAAMGGLFIAFQVMRLLFGWGKLLTAAADVIFCCLCAVTVFACALAVDHGRLRFIQAAAQLLGGWSVIVVFAPLTGALARRLNKTFCRISSVFHKYTLFLRSRFRRKKTTVAKKSKKRKEKTKKAQKKT